MYDLYEARNSIYCYENTDILKNKLNIKGKEDRYSLNDIVGKTGVEYIFEDYLKGTDGIKQIDMALCLLMSFAISTGFILL